MKKIYWLLPIFIVGFLFVLPYSRKGIIETMENFLDTIYKKWAEFRSMDWKLLKAIALTESNENPNAIGDDGASLGLMQVQYLIGSFYADITSREELFDPDKNIEAGSAFLKEMIDKYGLEGGIQAYNLGETKYRKGLRSPIYLSKVLAHYEKIKMSEV